MLMLGLSALPKEVGCPFLWHQTPMKSQGPSNSYSARNEGRREGVMDERTPDMPSLQYILKCLTEELGRQLTKTPLAAAFSPFMRAYCNHPTHDVNDV